MEHEQKGLGHIIPVSDGAKLYPTERGRGQKSMIQLNGEDLNHTMPPASVVSPNWYAAYTCAQHEKSVARQLEARSIECFLPLYEKTSLWKDRRVKVQFPLFAGYVFVRLSLEGKLPVLQVPGVVRLVGFNGRPIPLPDDEMRALRNGATASVHAEPCPYLQIGRLVRVISGPLAGLEGNLLKKKDGLRFVVSLHLLQRSVTVEIQPADLEQI
jgi:transcription antitermination factor NusG